MESGLLRVILDLSETDSTIPCCKLSLSNSNLTCIMLELEQAVLSSLGSLKSGSLILFGVVFSKFGGLDGTPSPKLHPSHCRLISERILRKSKDV